MEKRTANELHSQRRHTQERNKNGIDKIKIIHGIHKMRDTQIRKTAIALIIIKSENYFYDNA